MKGQEGGRSRRAWGVTAGCRRAQRAGGWHPGWAAGGRAAVWCSGQEQGERGSGTHSTAARRQPPPHPPFPERLAVLNPYGPLCRPCRVDLVVLHDALGFGQCHLALGVPMTGRFAGVSTLDQLRAMPWTEAAPLRSVGATRRLCLGAGVPLHGWLCVWGRPGGGGHFGGALAAPPAPRIPRGQTVDELAPDALSFLPPPCRVVTGYQNIARRYFAAKGFEHVVLLSADGARSRQCPARTPCCTAPRALCLPRGVLTGLLFWAACSSALSPLLDSGTPSAETRSRPPNRSTATPSAACWQHHRAAKHASNLLRAQARSRPRPPWAAPTSSWTSCRPG